MIPSLAGARSVLVRLPNWLGDALMARPFLRALRDAAPVARLTAAGPAGLLELLETDATWNEALALGTGRGSPGRQTGRPDIAYVLPPSFSSAWFAWRAGARERIGYASDARSPLLTQALRRPPRGERHLSREYLALLDESAARASSPPLPPPLPVSAAARAAAEGALSGLGLASVPLALLAPGALYGPAKRWPAARFGELARSLADAGYAAVACGGPREVEACDAVVSAGGGACRTLAGRTTLAAQAGLCARARVVVSNDSGLAHLAAAIGTPTVAIFGSTSSAWTAPLGPHVRIVQRPPVCSPCFRRTCAIGYACLEAVSVRSVSDAVAAVCPGAGAGEGGSA